MYLYGFFQTDLLNKFFIPLRRTEAITCENFVPAIETRGPALPGRNFLHVTAKYILWKIYNTAGIPAKRDRISLRPTGIM